jgi:uncharacterized protein with PIN domain
MILDSPAVTAAICREPDAERILETLNSAKLVAIGGPRLPKRISRFGQTPPRPKCAGIARTAGMPILSTGNDFNLTDLKLA